MHHTEAWGEDMLGCTLKLGRGLGYRTIGQSMRVRKTVKCNC